MHAVKGFSTKYGLPKSALHIKKQASITTMEDILARDNVNDILEKIDKIIKVQDSFDYLLNMSLISLTKERMEKLKEEIITLKEELTQIENTSIEQMWLYDLSSF